MHERNPLDALEFETERTLYVFYGYAPSAQDGDGGPYFKSAHSLSHALADLRANPGVEDAPYVVTDIFVEVEEGEPTLHVELRDPTDAAARDEEAQDA